jgi:hypothetical protein
MLEAALFTESWPLIFDFVWYVLLLYAIPFYNESGSKSVQEPKSIQIPVSRRQKAAAPVRQHCYLTLDFPVLFSAAFKTIFSRSSVFQLPTRALPRLQAVLWIRIRKFLGLPDPDPSVLVRIRI